jgi:hypothetical protein
MRDLFGPRGRRLSVNTGDVLAVTFGDGGKLARLVLDGLTVGQDVGRWDSCRGKIVKNQRPKTGPTNTPVI